MMSPSSSPSAAYTDPSRTPRTRWPGTPSVTGSKVRLGRPDDRSSTVSATKKVSTSYTAWLTSGWRTPARTTVASTAGSTAGGNTGAESTRTGMLAGEGSRVVSSQPKTATTPAKNHAHAVRTGPQGSAGPRPRQATARPHRVTARPPAPVHPRPAPTRRARADCVTTAGRATLRAWIPSPIRATTDAAGATHDLTGMAHRVPPRGAGPPGTCETKTTWARAPSKASPCARCWRR